MENEIIQKVIKYNSPEKTVLKVLEECAELSEVLLKYLTKTPEFKPPIEKIIEEMGDVKVRMKILANALGITEKVEEREHLKLLQLKEWVEQKYEGVV